MATGKAEAAKFMQVKASESCNENKFLQGQGITRQRATTVDGIRLSVGECCGRQKVHGHCQGTRIIADNAIL